MEQASKARDEQAKLAQERQAQVEQLTQTKAAADKQSQERSHQLEQASKARDEQAKLAEGLHAKLEQLTRAQAVVEKQTQEQTLQLVQAGRERDEQARQVQEYQAQIKQLTQAKVAVEKRAQELEQAGRAHDEQVKLALERQARTEQFVDAKDVAEKQIQELQQQIKNAQEQLQIEVEQNLDVQSLFKKQSDELVRLRKSLDASLKKAITNATRQIQAFTGLENYWRTGDLPTANNESHAWPVSPDFSLYVVTLLEKNDYDLVIEFGTGVSTVVVAKTLVKLATRREGRFPVSFVSFDHLEQYYKQTLSMLQQAGLASYVQLHHAPLVDWKAPNGQIYPYYSCQELLENLARKYPPAGLRVLVIVDGPPGATSPHARYPAAPLILNFYAGAHIDFLLDDYARVAEKETAQLWVDEIGNDNLKYQSTHIKLEKDAFLISVDYIK